MDVCLYPRTCPDYLQGCQGVGQGLAVGVMAVDGQGCHGHLMQDSGQHVLHGPRGAHADGVPQGDLVAAHGVQLLGDLGRQAGLEDPDSSSRGPWPTQNTSMSEAPSSSWTRDSLQLTGSGTDNPHSAHQETDTEEQRWPSMHALGSNPVALLRGSQTPAGRSLTTFTHGVTPRGGNEENDSLHVALSLVRRCVKSGV